MKRVSICAAAFLVCNAVFAFAVMAARLPTSTLVVEILSVDQTSFTREPGRKEHGQIIDWVEITRFVAKAKIVSVVNTDHGLMSGATIEIKYKIVNAAFPVHNKPLKPGENVTLVVMGGMNGGYERLN
jgi:hypothetical protein